MPAGTITTQFLIGGQLLPSFMTSMTKANQTMIKLQRTTASSTQSLAGLAKGFTGIAVAAAAITAATAAVAAMGKVFGEAIEEGRKEQNLIAAIGVELQNVNKRLGLNANAWKGMTDDIVKQSYALEEQSGVYHQIFLQGAATLGQYHVSHAAIVDILNSSKDLLAVQRLRGKSEEEIAKTYDAIGKALMGQPRGLKAVGIELDAAQQKMLSHLTALGKWKEAIQLINNIMKQSYAGGEEAWKKTPAGQSAMAYSKWRDALVKISPELQEVDLRLKQMAYTLGASIFGSPEMAAFIHWLNTQTESLQRFLNKALPAISKSLHEFTEGFNQGWKQAFGEDFNTSVTRATDFLKKQFNEAFNYITGLNWKDIGKTIAAGVKDSVDELKADWKEMQDEWNALVQLFTKGKLPGQTSEFGRKYGSGKPANMPQALWDSILKKGKEPGYGMSQEYVDATMQAKMRWGNFTGAVGSLFNPQSKVLESDKKLKESLDTLNASIQTVINTNTGWWGTMGTNYAGAGGGGRGGGGGGGGGPIYKLGQGLSPAQATGKGSNTHIPYSPQHYAAVDAATNVIAELASKEGLEKGYDPGTSHMSIAGLWEGTPGIEGQSYAALASMTPAQRRGPAGMGVLKKVWGAWAAPTGVGKATSPGLQELIMADAQHFGGGSVTISRINAWIAQHGGWDKINASNPTDVINDYANFRRQAFWHDRPAKGIMYGSRMQEERDWALKHATAGSAGSGVTINYTVHHHGDGSDHNAIAALHRKHMLDLKDKVEDIVYERNRRSYVPRYV